MASSVYFNGEQITLPGAYSAIDTSGMITKASDETTKTIAFVGECTGGQPETVMFFTSPISAAKTLKSGDLLKACEKAWDPVSKTKYGVTLGGANLIACIRTNRATQSKYIVKPKRNERMSVIAEVPDDETVYLGKQIKELVNDARILDDGSVRGILKWVTKFTAFNENVSAEQNGYYMPIKLVGEAGTGEKMTIKKNGVATEAKTDMKFDPEILVRVEDKSDTYTIEVDGKEVITLTFTNTILGEDNGDEEPKQHEFVSKDVG